MHIIQPFFDATIESSPVSYIHRKPSPIKAPSSQDWKNTGRSRRNWLDWKIRRKGCPRKKQGKGSSPFPLSRVTLYNSPWTSSGSSHVHVQSLYSFIHHARAYSTLAPLYLYTLSKVINSCISLASIILTTFCPSP